jgi:hypothetical protein
VWEARGVGGMGRVMVGPTGEEEEKVKNKSL